MAGSKMSGPQSQFHTLLNFVLFNKASLFRTIQIKFMISLSKMVKLKTAYLQD